MDSITKKLIACSFMNYVSYATNTFMIFILLSTYNNLTNFELGAIMSSILALKFLSIYLKGRVFKFEPRVTWLINQCVYLFSFIVLFITALFSLPIYIFILFAALNTLCYQLAMFEYKNMLHQSSTSNSVKIETYSQITIEVAYGLGILLAGIIAQFIDAKYLMLFDFVFSSVFTLLAYQVMKNFNSIKATKSEKFIIKNIAKQEFIAPIVLACFGYILFKQDDSVIAKTFSTLSFGAMSYGAMSYGIYTVSTAIVATLSLLVVDKLAISSSKRMIGSLISIFISLLFIVNISTNIMFVIPAFMLSGAGVAVFLGTVKGYMIKKTNNRNDSILFCQTLENFFEFLNPIMFLPIIGFSSTAYILVLVVLALITIIAYMSSSQVAINLRKEVYE